jgi:hypothetical protein
LLLFLRRSFLLSSIAALSACSATGQSAAPPATAAVTQVAPESTIQRALDSAPAVTGGFSVTKALPIHPDAGGPAILINFISNGPAQGGVPCIACVNGASSNDNIGLTGPSSYVYKGSTWQYSLSFTDLTYKGKCKLAWAITSGQKTIDSFSVTINLDSSGGFVLYALNRSRPKYSGSATVTGKVTCGKQSPSLQAPIEFQ